MGEDGLSKLDAPVMEIVGEPAVTLPPGVGFTVKLPPLPPDTVTVVMVCVPDAMLLLPPVLPTVPVAPPVPTVTAIVLPGVREVK